MGTKVMEPVAMKLYELESEADRKPGRLGAARSSLRNGRSEDGCPPGVPANLQAGGASRATFSLWTGHELGACLHPAPSADPAPRVGYASLSHFIRVFSRHVGGAAQGLCQATPRRTGPAWCDISLSLQHHLAPAPSAPHSQEEINASTRRDTVSR